MIDLCKLFYDWTGDGRPPSAGDYLRGQGVRGLSPRAYRIYSVRKVNSKVHPGRLSLTVERIRADDIPDGTEPYLIRWYSRNSKRSKIRGIP